jgi:hypothetical protein
MSHYWRSNREALKNVTIVSIAGGSLDNIIHSDGVNIDSIIPSTHGFTTYTTAIPGVWTGADHMAILWCNQLIQLLAETLHGYLNLGDNPSVEARMKLFRLYLLDGRDYSLIKNQSLRQKHFDQLNYIDLDEHRSQHVFLDSQVKQDMVLFKSNSSLLQFITNVDPKFDSCWALASCTKSGDCDYIQPRVRVVPSASATNLVDSAPYRVFTVKGSNDYIGLTQQCRITSASERPFIQAYKLSNQPTIHTNSVWGKNTSLFFYTENSLFNI